MRAVLTLNSADSWPGDHIIWSDNDGKKRPAVVKNWNVRQRTLDLLFPDTQETQSVSALEIDDALGGPCGVKIGTEVLLCDDNGTPAPQVPTIGQNQPLGDLMYLMDHMDPKLLEDSEENEPLERSLREQWSVPEPDNSHIDWYGQVIFLRPDGRVDVRLGNLKVVTVELKNLYRVSPPPISSLLAPNNEDSYDDEDDDIMGSMFFGPMSSMGPMGNIMTFSGSTGLGTGPSLGMGPFDPINFFGGPPPANNQHEAESDRSWETTDDEDWDPDDEMDVDDDDEDYDDEGDSESDGEDKAKEEDVDNQELPPSEPTKPDPPQKPDETTAQDAMDIEEVNIQLGTSPTLSAPSPSNDMDPTPTSPAGPSRLGDSSKRADEGLVSFDICETAPQDHHFYARSPAETNRTRMARLNKEHKALRSSLPGKLPPLGKQVRQS